MIGVIGKPPLAVFVILFLDIFLHYFGTMSLADNN